MPNKLSECSPKSFYGYAIKCLMRLKGFIGALSEFLRNLEQLLDIKVRITVYSEKRAQEMRLLQFRLSVDPSVARNEQEFYDLDVINIQNMINNLHEVYFLDNIPKTSPKCFMATNYHVKNQIELICVLYINR